MKRIAFAACALLCLTVLPSTYANAKGFHVGVRLPWCGIYMSQYFGLHDRKLWLAANWRFEGSPASGPCVGCVVVFPHHVGVIAGGPNDKGLWLVHSGNDGNAVRTRYRSLRGAIAFRHVGGASFGASAHIDLEVKQEAPRRRHKHLVPLAVKRRHATLAAELKQPRTQADVTGFAVSAGFSIAPEADMAHEIVRHHRKPVR